MKKASKTNIDKLLKPAMDALKQTAAEAIRDAQNSIRNVLQVRYDAGPECFPKGLPVPSLQMRRERHVPGLGFPCHSELVFPLREFDIRNEKTKSGFGVFELAAVIVRDPAKNFSRRPGSTS